MPPERLSIEYWTLSRCLSVLWEKNPHLHDIGMISLSIEKHGFRDPIEYDDTGEITAGHGRIEAVAGLFKRGPLDPNQVWPPKYILTDPQTGEWKLPITVGACASSREDARSYGIDNNNITMMGGDFTPAHVAKTYNANYLEILTDLCEQKALPVTVDQDTLEYLIQREERKNREQEALPDPGPASLSYTIDFDSDRQRQLWFDFLEFLRREYLELDTVQERIAKYAEMVAS